MGMSKFDAKCVLNFYSDQVEVDRLAGTTVADFYEHALFADAINALVPNFEYPDWSHLTMTEALRKINTLNK